MKIKLGIIVGNKIEKSLIEELKCNHSFENKKPRK